MHSPTPWNFSEIIENPWHLGSYNLGTPPPSLFIRFWSVLRFWLAVMVCWFYSWANIMGSWCAYVILIWICSGYFPLILIYWWLFIEESFQIQGILALFFFRYILWNEVCNSCTLYYCLETTFDAISGGVGFNTLGRRYFVSLSSCLPYLWLTVFIYSMLCWTWLVRIY